MFHRTRRPVEVSFRDLHSVRGAEGRASHDLHPYPARLLVNIPSFFLATSLSQPGELVLDPFCGSGTVLLEATLAGRDAAGADANPLARLITRVKLTPIAPEALRRAQRAFFSRLPSELRRAYPAVVNLEYWFYPHVRRDLLRLLDTVGRMRDATLRDFFGLVLSACLKDVSLADPRLSVPVRLQETQYPPGHWLHRRTKERLSRLRTINVPKVFAKRLEESILRLTRLVPHRQLGRFVGVAADARQLVNLADDSVDLVMTSPPYPGAQKYIRASSLSLTWLGLCTAADLRGLEDLNIGREHFRKALYEQPSRTDILEADALITTTRESNPLRAHMAATYLLEMRNALREIARVLKPGRHMVLVAGASRVCGLPFPTPGLLTEIAESQGLRLRLHLLDSIRSRALMTKRHHTAGRIDTEAVLLFQKDVR